MTVTDPVLRALDLVRLAADDEALSRIADLTVEDHDAGVRARIDWTLHNLEDALQAAWQTCDDTSCNLPELIRAALESLAVDLGSVHALTQHRPGSWEATHIENLAAGAEWILESQEADR